MFKVRAVLLTATVTPQVAFMPLPSFAVAVMRAVPLPLGVTTPLLLTVATAMLLLVHVTPMVVAVVGVMVAVSVFVLPVLVNSRCVWLSTTLVTGVLTMIVAEVLLPDSSFACTVIVVLPFAKAVTLPLASTVATFVLLLVQVTDLFSAF